MNQSKKFHLVNCPNCFKSFGDKNLPKILPCGKTFCRYCEKILLEFDRNEEKTFKCKMCDSEHKLPKGSNGFPTNEILLDYLISTPSSNQATRIPQENLRKIMELNQLEINVAKLNNCIENLEKDLQANFLDIKQKIVARTDEVVRDVYKCRDKMLEDLEIRQKTSVAHYNNNKDKISMFHKECNKNLQKLLNESENSDKRSEINEIATSSAEINEQILKVLIYFENCTDIKLRKSKQTIDMGLIGDLINPIDIHQETDIPKSVSFSRNASFSKSRSDRKTTARSSARKSSKIHYKLPLNTKNMEILPLNNRDILKAMELESKQEFSFVLNIQLIDRSGQVLRKLVHNINTYRMRRIKINKQNSHIAVLLVNTLLNKYCLLLFSIDLKLLKRHEIHYIPTDIFLSESGIYVKSAHAGTVFHKYNYTLDHIRSFGQTLDEDKPFHIPKSSIVTGIEAGRIFFIEPGQSKLKIISENNGKKINTIDSVRESSLVYIDASRKSIHILDKYHGQHVIKVFNWDAHFLHEKEVDSRIQSADTLVVLDDVVAVNDKKNLIIYEF